MPKIFCWVNAGVGTDWQVIMAVAEDGTYLASHVSTNAVWARHDIGFDSDRKHQVYKTHYPNGYELVWVENSHDHKGLQAALRLDQEKTAALKQETA